MGRPRKYIEEPEEVLPEIINYSKTRLDYFLEVYEFLKSEGIHSISALEVKIQQLQKDL